MKSNFSKYIFIIFAIGIMIFAIIKIKNDEKKNDTQQVQIEEKTEEITKELKLGVASFDSINPILSKNKNIQDISKIIFDSLVTISTDYKAELSLAKEWAKQSDTEYLIKLREDVKWSDGEKFTADDVRFTIDRLKDSDTIYSANVAHVIKVETVDNSTVKIILDQEVPFFEYNLTFPILSSKYYSDKEFTPNIVPLGTGMYKVTEVQSSAIILEKNEYYWKTDEKLTLEKITINNFLGTYYNRSKYFKADSDFITYYNILGLHIEIDGKEQLSLMDLDKFKGSDKYSAFLWGNNGLTKVINENISEERKGSSILIFKDSYANSFIQFLSYNYEIIDIIDLRYFKESIRNFMKDFSMIREEKDFTILMPIIGKVLGEYPEDYKGEAKDE